MAKKRAWLRVYQSIVTGKVIVLYGCKIIKEELHVHISHPADAIAAVIAYLPEERKALGLFARAWRVLNPILVRACHWL